MIKVISGVCNTNLGLKCADDEPFTLAPEIEKRFVDRGVAAYVRQETPVWPVATLPAAPVQEEVSVTLAPEEPGAETQETAANLDVDQLKELKLAELKLLAEDMGVDTTGLRTKDDYAKAIAAMDVIVEDVVE